MAVTSAKLSRAVRANETIALALDLVTDPQITHDGGLADLELSPTSTPVVDAVWSDSISLSGGAASIDLAALARGDLANLDLSGKKVQAIQFSCPSANTAFVAIAPGATNPYPVFGSGNEFDLPAGADVTIYVPEGLGDVGASAKEIDFASSDVDAVIKVVIYAG